MQKINTLLNLLDSNISLLIRGLARREIERINEIRLRKGQPLCAVINGKSYYIGNSSRLTENPALGHICTESNIQQSFLGITRHSVYAYEEQIAQGYITLPDGNRAGLGGSFAFSDGQYRLKDISSICIRIAREHKGCADVILPYINTKEQVHSLLVISPPGGGKTTLLRELAGKLSLSGRRVCIIDERGELAGLHNGAPSLDVGHNTDVIGGCLKKDGILMACRSLCPDVIVFDEIGTEEEAVAVKNALNCGVGAIFSVHADSLPQALSRQQIKLLKDVGIIEYALVLSGAGTPGEIKDFFIVKEGKNESICVNNSILSYDSGRIYESGGTQKESF